MRRLVVLAVLGGCGRYGFGASDGAAGSDAPPQPDGRFDAPAGAMTCVFGGPAPSCAGGTIDTYVSQDMEKGDERPNNYGGDEELKIKSGEEHALLEFDIAAVPPSSTIFTVDLVLFATDPGASSAIAVHRLGEDWSEGDLEGTPGRCNWWERDAVPTAWTTAGASPAASGSADPNAVASFTPIAGMNTIALPPDLAEGWLVASENHGVVLVATQDSADFLSSEATPTAGRPALVVTYGP